ncbi:MAG TPA: glycosyltransferase [Hyphomicrobiaceae bacterium]|nr:glycosyltransferase [Hyphomicrobiaceae bacterium]
MRILFVHQNFPGQFPHLAPALKARGHDVSALTVAGNKRPSPVPVVYYSYPKPSFGRAISRAVANFADRAERGAAVATAAEQLKAKGYVPEVVIGHFGWGETLYLKNVWPDIKLAIYAEFFYRPRGLDTDYDPEIQHPNLSSSIVTTTLQAPLLLAMHTADAAIAPTRWQAQTFPAHFQPRIAVIHDGIDSERLVPNAAAQVTIGRHIFRSGDEVLTFVSRNLEPYRGYHVFMRALPEVLRARPNAHVVIVGGQEAGYGPLHASRKAWKEIFLDEVKDRLDLARVHFVGTIPYASFVNLMSVTRVHAYLTYPFVLSWSMLEAMSAGALVVGSATPPVEEIIRHGSNGLLVDFFDRQRWSATLIEALAEPNRFAPLRVAARQTILEGYDLKSNCLPRMLALVESLGSQPGR